jgi:hypothetical protein
MLRTFSHMRTVYFPTKIVKSSATLIDNIITDNRRNYKIEQCVNGLSDQDAQLITINNAVVLKEIQGYYHNREINNSTMVDFQLLLSWKCWQEIFGNTDVNNMFNSFHNTYLRCFHASCPIRETRYKNNLSKWVIKGIRISCNRNRGLVILCRHSNDINLKIYLKQCSKILSKVTLKLVSC